MKSTSVRFRYYANPNKLDVVWASLSDEERHNCHRDIKSASDAFNIYLRGKRLKTNCESVPAETALWMAGGRDHLGLFRTMLDEGRVDIKKFVEKKGLLISMIANGGIDAAILLIDRSRQYGLNLDTHDTFEWRQPRSWHERMGVADNPKFEDRLHWQRTKYLRNTALILSVKKGWDHASEMNKLGELHPENRIKKTKMGRVTQALLRNGAHPDVQDACGNTALHIAVMHRDVRTIEALKDAGGRNDIPNKHGWRPLDLLDLEYEDIGPFLYQQTGNDVNCYIFTLKDRMSWLRAGDAVREALENWSVPHQKKNLRVLADLRQ